MNARLSTLFTKVTGGKTAVRFQLEPCSSTLTIDASRELTGILMLNIYLLIPIMTSVVNGIDSSNLNGLFSSRIQMQRMC